MDCVTAYLARPGQERAFVTAVARGYLASDEPQIVLSTPDAGCCALLGEVRGSGSGSGSGSDGAAAAAATAQQADAAAAAAAAAGAEPEALAQPERAGALERLHAQPLLEQLLREHGSALVVHFIATRPERQGQGLGACVLGGVCALADAQRRHAYLEASTPRSKVPAACCCVAPGVLPPSTLLLFTPLAGKPTSADCLLPRAARPRPCPNPSCRRRCTLGSASATLGTSRWGTSRARPCWR